MLSMMDTSSFSSTVYSRKGPRIRNYIFYPGRRILFIFLLAAEHTIGIEVFHGILAFRENFQIDIVAFHYFLQNLH